MIKKYIKISGLAIPFLIGAIANPAIAAPTAITTNSSQFQQLFTKISQQLPNVSAKAIRLSLTAYEHAIKHGQATKPYLTIVDFTKASNEKRFYVIDMRSGNVLYDTYAAHGRGSGKLYAKRFSNVNGTHESSLGVYITKNTYIGGKGTALRLQGLEPGINTNALKRTIVVHGAWYANESFVKKNGYAGRSWGCPAIPQHLIKPVTKLIKGGSVLVAYFPQGKWVDQSEFLTPLT